MASPQHTTTQCIWRASRISYSILGGTLYDLYFGYMKRWWPYRNDPNVLLLHYADAKKDLNSTVSKLAQFVGVELSPAEHKEVTRRCDIKHMKTISDKFDYIQWAGDGSKIVNSGSLIRTGGVGEGKAFFTAEMQQLWSTAVQSVLVDPEVREWAAEGGTFS